MAMMYISKGIYLDKCLSYNSRLQACGSKIINCIVQNDLNIKLDHVSDIFQNLNGATEDVDLNFGNKYSNSYVTFRNLAYNTEPLIVHGNGPSKVNPNTI